MPVNSLLQLFLNDESLIEDSSKLFIMQYETRKISRVGIHFQCGINFLNFWKSRKRRATQRRTQKSQTYFTFNKYQ